LFVKATRAHPSERFDHDHCTLAILRGTKQWVVWQLLIAKDQHRLYEMFRACPH
jgi:hypothetical protein